MFTIDLEQRITNTTVNCVIEYIKKYGMNDRLYKQIATLFSKNTSRVTYNFKRKLAGMFVEYETNPILVLEVRELVRDDEELFKKYGGYFAEYSGAREMFGVEETGAFDIDEFRRDAPVKEERKKRPFEKKKRSRNKTKTEAKKGVLEQHKSKKYEKERQKRAFGATEELIKKYR